MLFRSVFHSFNRDDKDSYLAALQSMLENGIINIWGHPTVFAERAGIRLDDNEIIELIQICVNNDIMLEKNLKYQVPDSNFINLAIKKGANFVIGSDAHNINELICINKLKEEFKSIGKMY